MNKFKYFIPAIIFMLFIFYMSNQVADTSTSTSGFFVDIIRSIFSLDESYIDILQTIIRKGAHMSEYALLGILFYYGFSHLQAKYVYILSFITSLLYACTDEFHQLFIPGRSGSIIDVGIDSIGIIIGLLIIFIFYRLTKKKSL